VVGELAIGTLGSGTLPLALATFSAMAAAQALGGARIVIAQAAGGAILTVAAGDGDVGIQRLEDALIGGAIALLFTQVLFAPDPVALLRRAEAAALADMAQGLRLTADALERNDDTLAERALNQLRGLRDRLTELARTREASKKVARRTPAWRSRHAPVVRESENAGHLDLLGGSCLALARTAIVTRSPHRRSLAPAVRELATALAELAADPGDRQARQHAADRALRIAREPAGGSAKSEPQLAPAVWATRMVATDVMVFAGADPDQANAMLRADASTALGPVVRATPRPSSTGD
jgi:hypothetical protein